MSPRVRRPEEFRPERLHRRAQRAQSDAGIDAETTHYKLRLRPFQFAVEAGDEGKSKMDWDAAEVARLKGKKGSSQRSGECDAPR